MTTNRYIMRASFFFLWMGLSATCWAGQFVTQELRTWATDAVEQESSLETRSADKRTLAVLYFHNKTGWAELKPVEKGLAIMLITDLAKVKEIQLVERARIQALVEELDFRVSDLVVAEHVPRMGRLLGATLVVGGAIEKKSQSEFQLSSGLMNVSREKMLGEPTVGGKLLEELFRMEKDLLFEIIRLLEIELSPKRLAELREPLTDSLEALLYFFQAIEAADEGDFKDANDLLDKSLGEDPDFALSGNAKREIAGIFPDDQRYSNGANDNGNGAEIKKECAAARNNLKRNVFKSRRRF